MRKYFCVFRTEKEAELVRSVSIGSSVSQAGSIVKIFKVVTRQYHKRVLWEFRCRQSMCDTCKVRFLCFTTSKNVMVWHAGLVERLNDCEIAWHSSYAQKEARAEFFHFLENYTDKLFVF